MECYHGVFVGRKGGLLWEVNACFLGVIGVCSVIHSFCEFSGMCVITLFLGILRNS